MRFFVVKSEDGKTWTELVKAAPWSARWGFGAAQLKEQLVIMGHLDEDNKVVGFRGLRMLMRSEHPR